MSLVPDSKLGKISFYANRVDQWADRAAEIGTTPEQVAQLADFTAEAREAFDAQALAQQAAQAATLRLHNALEKMTTAGAQIILQVRSKASRDGDPIYALATIDPPARPSPIAEPGKPHGFAAELWQNGALQLKWKCKNPAGAVGTTYHIERRTGAFEPMVYLGTVGEKKFVDETIPAGTASVVYQVRAVRSTKVGPVAQFNVQFHGSGKMTGGMVIKPKRALIAA
jgi:hypothetical protein